MENAVYWNGHQVGIECAGRISWFVSAPADAIAAYGTPHKERVAAGDSVVARNLMVTQPDRFDFRG
ncbi:hypothetical protein [Paraburkholderia susongensis]|uniref:Uncharacterized protein n=1 Tax=Paraburkholderia susongensis TaxID=1515439 RepID=A0A1X7ISE4_9BURK|nr:hypothetical protein [Paraburkholderia susongensis]SMG17417.1 hypothetical protein SAMN06265784_101946 [Paraburkholderia susongensis]